MLKSSGTQPIGVWVTTPSVSSKGVTLAGLKTALAQDKKGLLAQLAQMPGITVTGNSSQLPLIQVEATTAALKTLSKHPSVASLHILRPSGATTMGTTTAEQQNMYWSDVLESFPAVTNDVNVAMFDTCHPSTMLRMYQDLPGDANDSMAYMPGISETSPDYCSWLPLEDREHNVSHADKTHSILYARPDGHYSPARGKNGMLHALSSQVRSLALYGIKGSKKAPGATCASDPECCSGMCSSAHCTGPCMPDSADVASALFGLLSSSPAPDVLSISVWGRFGVDPVTGASIPPDCDSEPDLAMRSLDWQATMLPGKTNIVFAAGNAGYEATSMYYYCCDIGGVCGSVGNVGTTDEAHGGGCSDLRDNDGDGKIDCDDEDCNDPDGSHHGGVPTVHSFCRQRHHVLPKLRNAIIVGGYDSDGRENGEHPEADHMGDYVESVGNAFSSWRAGVSPHHDRILPHVVAAGRSVQAADHHKDSFFSSDGFRWWGVYENEIGVDATGTSFAAPQVAALASYVRRKANQEFPSNARVAQQATRAVIMASARHNPKSFYWNYDVFQNGHWEFARSLLRTGAADARTGSRKHRDGAGAVGGRALAHLLPAGPSSGSVSSKWGGGDIEIPEGGQPPPVKVPFVWPEEHTSSGYGRVRIALTWNPTVQCTEPDQCTPQNWTQGHDLDLCFYEEAGQQDILVGCANSWDNNYELMDTQMKKDGTGYYILISVYSGQPLSTVSYGVAVYCDAYHDGIP